MKTREKNIMFGIAAAIMLALIIIPCSIHTSSAKIVNFTMSENANKTYVAIENAKLDMLEMLEAGFNIARVNDTISECTQLFDAQLALEEKKGSAKYSDIMEKIGAVAEIKKSAFLAYDEMKALNDSLNSKIIKSADANFTKSILLFAQAQKEFYDERYEVCLQDVEQTYSAMTEAEAEASRLNTFYKAATYGIANFFKQNWKIISGAAAFVLIVLLIMRKRIMVARLKRKLKKLELEKQVILDLIKKAQKDYFESGKLSEANYRIKTKKFSELIRDIDRQVPLIREELEKRKKREKSSKK